MPCVYNHVVRSLVVAPVVALLLFAACRHDPVLNPNKKRKGDDMTKTLVIGAAKPGTVQSRAGATVDLAPLWESQRVIVVFYRGHWCPHCQHQLGELNKVTEQLAVQKVTIIAISSDTPADAEVLHKKLGLTFEVYSDTDLKVITSWGVGDYGAGISKPATFIIEPGGDISFRRVGEKPSDHPSVSELLAALRAPQKSE